MTAHVLHTGIVCGHPVRFFKTPNNDGLPDLPWHSVEDLQHALGLNREARKFFLHKMRNSEWGGVARTVATNDGLVTIAPHFMAQGLLGGLIETGMALPRAETDYAHASAEAGQKLIPAHLHFPDDEWMQYMAAAMKWHEKAGAADQRA